MVEKAKLVEVKFKTGELPKPEAGHDVIFQFNPQTLKLTVANENKGGDQASGASKQFTGKSTTKLAVELLFDTTQIGTDVRLITAKVRYFIQPHPSKQKGKLDAPPGVQFEWGTFIFPGVVDSLQETLDYFAEDGTPLRATIALGISHQEIVFPTEQETPGTASGMPGQVPLDTVGVGKNNLPAMAGQNGNSQNWKATATANNIDNPLHLSPGSLLDLNAGASAGLSLGAQGGIGASAGISGGIGFSAGLGGGAGFSAGAGAGIGASAGISAGAGIGGGISAGFGANAGAGIRAGVGIGSGASAGVGASAGFSAGAGIGASAGVSGGVGGSIGAVVGGSASAQAGISGGASVVAGGGFGAGVDIPGR